ncbi:MAG: fumarylacetoacetate hydrolase family protein [Actinobacteria bacterium]|nr:fumarylacetoacetate hydrolase family protein [Actinomycetota bacterium]
MRFRKVELTGGGTSVAVWDDARRRWLPLTPALAAVGRGTGGAAADGPSSSGSSGAGEAALAAYADDLVGLLAGGAPTRAALADLTDRLADRDFSGDFSLTPQLPFQPRLLRAYANSERHWIQGAHGLVRLHMPRVLPLARAVEAITRKPFKPFRPGKLFYRQPAFYLGNPLTIIPSGAEAPWPPYTERFDFELELAAIVVKPLLNATPEQAREAIGGFVAFNDFSARDTQWHELREGMFGPVIKTKTFASAIGAEVVSADEILPRLRELTAEVRVNGDLWSSTGTKDMRWDFGEMAAFASAGEQVFAGELISAGTMPDGCGLELGRWLRPGDTIELWIDGVGTVTSTIGSPQTAPDVAG